MPVPSPFQIVDTPLYDTLSIPLGFSSSDRATLFTVPVGNHPYHDPLTGEPRVKDYTETNMWMSGLIPAPDEFTIRSIRAALFSRRGDLLPITARHYRGALLELFILERRYFAAPLWKVVDPAVLFAAAGVNGFGGFNADERLEIVRSVRHTFAAEADPVVIRYQEPFRVDLKVDPTFEWDKLSSPGSLVVVLEGSLRRPVM